MTHIIPTPRSSDDQILEWLHLRSRGYSLRQVKDITGYAGSRGTLRLLTERVRKADETEAAFWGDTPEQAAEGYW